ncbi:HNH endonuclease [Parabacteroides sp. OttesenSCG-928-J18]|nr:HNH endonuclease [Parabacteroides sp. OttesenSCG-928-J18]
MPFLKSIEEAAKKREEHNKKFGNKKGWIHKNVYNTSKWRKLRLQKLQEQPLCEVCKKNDIIKLATQVHHIKEISTGYSDEKMLELAFDYTNLESICKDCHKEKHNKEINYFLFDE